jgi:LysW-gamma-L-lysine carboxypeptidase
VTTTLDEVPQTLLGLVSRFSPTGQEGAATGWLVERMLSLGFTQAFLDKAGNAVGLMGDGPRQMVLLGHIDTVPGEIPLRLEEGRFYGRGTVDAKGPLAAFVDAVAAAGDLEGWSLVVVGAVDEEGESRGARYLQRRYQPVLALVGEPSGWQRLTLGYKGSAWFDVTVRRPQAHSASGEPSASETVIGLWGALEKWAQGVNQARALEFERTAISLQGLSSGEDGFDNWAKLRIGTRLPPGLTGETLLGHFEQLLPGAEVELLGEPIPAYRGEKNTPLVRMFLRAIRQAGGTPSFVLKTGTADLNLVAPQWGCPALAYGPGDSALDHTPEEHILLEEYRAAVQVLQGVLAQLETLPA